MKTTFRRIPVGARFYLCDGMIKRGGKTWDQAPQYKIDDDTACITYPREGSCYYMSPDAEVYSTYDPNKIGYEWKE